MNLNWLIESKMQNSEVTIKKGMKLLMRFSRSHTFSADVNGNSNIVQLILMQYDINIPSYIIYHITYVILFLKFLEFQRFRMLYDRKCI